MLRSSYFMDYDDDLDEETEKVQKLGDDILEKIKSGNFDFREVENEIAVYVKKIQNIIKKTEEEENDNSN